MNTLEWCSPGLIKTAQKDSALLKSALPKRYGLQPSAGNDGLHGQARFKIIEFSQRSEMDILDRSSDGYHRLFPFSIFFEIAGKGHRKQDAFIAEINDDAKSS